MTLVVYLVAAISTTVPASWQGEAGDGESSFWHR